MCHVYDRGRATGLAHVTFSAVGIVAAVVASKKYYEANVLCEPLALPFIHS